MRYSARTLVSLLGVSSITLVFLGACSSSSNTQGPLDSGFPDQTSPPVDAGHDAKHDAHTKDAAKDTGTKKDAAKDAKEDVGHADTGGPDSGVDSGTHDGAAHDGATDGKHDGESDAKSDAHDAATLPLVQNYFMGRWDTSGVTVADTATGVGSIAEWPGSGVITTFMGANIGLTLTDTCNTSGQCDTITVELDGVAVKQIVLNTVSTMNASFAFPLKTGANTILINSTLYPQIATGLHTLGIFKNTDSFYGGQYVFGGFTPANMLATNNPKASYPFEHRIEFIGDDNTAGTGATGTSDTCDPATTTFDDEYDSYANLVAKHFNADRQNLSIANMGVYESDPAGGPPGIATQMYPLVLPSEPTSTWSFASYKPDLVVVNLGGYGDFSNVSTDPPTMSFIMNYEQSLETFLASVRMEHATAFILVTLGAGYGGDEQNTEANSYAQAAVQARITSNAESMSTIAFFAPSLTGNTYQGCNYRPGVSDQINMAGQVETEIHSLLQW